jgi:hypothetical protein
MKKILKEPLLHFVLLGGLIFAAYAWVNGFQVNDPDRIVVSLRQQENLARTFERTWQRPPAQAELNGLIVDFLRQEIAYRESQKMQLDRDDIVIRRRLRQKLEMLAEDVALMSPPDEAQLQEYLDSNRDKFRIPDTSILQQVFFSIENGSAEAGKRAAELLSQLNADPSLVDLEFAGDQSLLPPNLQDVRDAELDSLFGKGFAEGVSTIDAGTWGGPVRSGYGLHLVRVDNRVIGYVPELQEVYNAVQREWLTVRRSEAIDGLYERLGENYSISIEAPSDVLPDGGANQ